MGLKILWFRLREWWKQFKRKKSVTQQVSEDDSTVQLRIVVLRILNELYVMRRINLEEFRDYKNRVTPLVTKEPVGMRWGTSTHERFPEAMSQEAIARGIAETLSIKCRMCGTSDPVYPHGLCPECSSELSERHRQR